MQRTTLLCPHCVNSDYPLESHGLSWFQCPLCGMNLSKRDALRSNPLSSGHLPAFIENLLSVNKNVDKQMNNMVTESTDNLLHEIIMVRIFKKEAEKADNIAVKSEIDKIFDIILSKG